MQNFQLKSADEMVLEVIHWNDHQLSCTQFSERKKIINEKSRSALHTPWIIISQRRSHYETRLTHA